MKVSAPAIFDLFVDKLNKASENCHSFKGMSKTVQNEFLVCLLSVIKESIMENPNSKNLIFPPRGN